MIVSIDWLKDFVSFMETPEQLADKLTGAGLETTVFDGGETFNIDLTPNRPDCMSHLGVAREIALLTNKQITNPKAVLSEGSDAASDAVEIKIENEEGCPRYGARVVKGISVVSSPRWMVKRLEQCGIRSINSVVDISNYVLLELGHPLHIFDLALVEDSTITVRSAQKGEKFITLDGEERTLSKDHLLICDDKKPVGLAGIMGGQNTEVSETTTDLLIECAYFNPVTIRRGSKLLGMSTEASKRFERGVDYDDLHASLDRTAQLIIEICGGECLAGVVDCYPKNITPARVSFSPSKASITIGVEFDDEFISSTFDGLGIEHSKKGDDYNCRIPSFRPDLERPIDLIEELGRIYGFDRIPPKVSYSGDLTSFVDDEEKTADALRDYFSGIGFAEVVTNSLMSADEAGTVTSDSLAVTNPLSRDMSVLRPSLLPGLLAAVRYNQRRGEHNLAMFEFGKAFQKKDKKWREFPLFSGVACGLWKRKEWRGSPLHFDLLLMKGLVENLAGQFSLDGLFAPVDQKSNLLADALVYQVSGTPVVTFGLVERKILSHYEVDSSVVCFDLNLDIFDSGGETIPFVKLPQFPGIHRDLSLTIPAGVTAGDIEKIIEQMGGQFLRTVRLYDLYEGDQIEAGMKSITFSLTFRSDERTLEDEDVDGYVEQIISETSSILGAKLR
ncbi:MAG: phenylalanine--tRNA ligase subunit beta [Candidatus Marinimicrobia bacterium]|nr:phenylalanine--tRNA ligase subunit beta [Candidatus Neomarinimicrobiota bacterium]